MRKWFRNNTSLRTCQNAEYKLMAINKTLINIIIFLGLFCQCVLLLVATAAQPRTWSPLPGSWPTQVLRGRPLGLFQGGQWHDPLVKNASKTIKKKLKLHTPLRLQCSTHQLLHRSHIPLVQTSYRGKTHSRVCHHGPWLSWNPTVCCNPLEKTEEDTQLYVL